MAITPEQTRAARALLGMTQADLAKQSGVSLRTVAGFESGEHRPIATISAALRGALEDAGTIFVEKDRVGGPGVRLATRRRKR